MNISLTELNVIGKSKAQDHFMRCCTSERWASLLADRRPFESLEGLLNASDDIWASMLEDDYLKAFEGHPQIGNVKTLKEKFQNTADSASDEQSAVNHANEETLNALMQANQAYLNKFGFIFIVFASDKTAHQMLELLHKRLHNSREQELETAAQEQNKITRLRLTKLIGST